jgi:hypothetical protein
VRLVEHVVTALFAVQALAGIVLLTGWWRHGRPVAPRVACHVGLGTASLAVWIVFAATGSVLWGWLAFAGITVGNAIGDSLMVRRSRRMDGGAGGLWSDYGTAISRALRGRLPPWVTFHALFAGVVYFTCLGVCIGATIAA